MLGSSFISDGYGALVQKANRTDQTILRARFDLHELEKNRLSWGLFRDRRPSQYTVLLTKDGSTLH